MAVLPPVPLLPFGAFPRSPSPWGHCFEPDAADLPHAAPQIALLDSMHTGAKFAKLVVPKLRLFLQERLRAEQRTGVLTAVPPERADPACLLPPRLREAAWPVPKQPARASPDGFP